MRGRNNNNNNNSNNSNRKGPNPLTRNYESNGPDVKIRGSAHQIAEKYMTLARDAQSAGDRVMAENYLQHAEHYNRIIAAAQAQLPQPTHRDARDDDDEDDRDETENTASDNRQQVNDGTGPQPEISGTPAEVALNPEASAPQPQTDRAEDGRAGNGNASAPSEGEAPRRPRRPRRRRTEGERAGPEAEAEASADAGERVEADPVS
jgi:hypothetical protein